MSLAAIISLVVFALILLVIELLVVPGGVLGITSILLMIYGIYEAYNEFGNQTGHIFLITTLVVSGLVIYYSFKSGAWKFLAHKGNLHGKANSMHEFVATEGKKGMTLSMLRPAGNAIFDGEKIEVFTEGEQVSPNSEIEIIAVRDHRIMVKPV